MKFKNEYVIGLLCYLLVSTESFAVTIDVVVQEAVKTHPNVKVATEEIRMQEEVLHQVKAQYYPTVDLSYSVGPEITKTPANQQNKASLIRQDASIVLKENLFSGLSTLNEQAQQESLIVSANEQCRDSANELARKTAKAYLEILKTRELLAIAKENTYLHQKYLEQVKKRVDAGAGINSDYMQTLSRYENTQDIEYMALLQYDNAVANFKSLLPNIDDFDNFVRPDDKIHALDTLDALIESAKQKNPFLLSAEASVRAMKAEAKKADSSYYPSVDIVAEAYWNDKVHGLGYDNPLISGVPSAADTEDSGYNALLVINYNLYNGGSDQALIEIKQHKMLKAQSNYLDMERSVVQGLTLSWNNFQILSTSMQHIQNYIDATAQTKADYEKEHELGRRSIVDLLNISVEYNNARNRKVNAQYDQLNAYYDVLAYSGQLFEEMHIVFE